MREVIVRFPAHALDGVLDRILPIVPDGVREAPAPRGQVELHMVGPHLPSLREIAQAVREGVGQISRALTDAVVISGAAAVPVGGAAATALLTVPELVDVAIANPGTGVELVVHNPTGAPLRIAVEDVGDITIPPGASAPVPLRTEPEGARLHLQALSTARSHVVMIMVAVEPSDDGPIAVAQGIGAPTC